LRRGKHRRIFVSESDSSKVLNGLKKAAKFKSSGNVWLYATDGAVIFAATSKIEGSKQLNGEIKDR
jgi:hypothetical protein